MAKLALGKILVNDELLKTSSADVYDPTTGESLAQQITSIKASLAGISGEEVSQLKQDLTALETTLQTFLTGEDDDNGALDRLKELIAAIQANKDSIAALVADKVTKDELDSLITRVKALEEKNWTLLDGISTNEATGNLVFNGKELTGETGIAIGGSAEAASVYNGKIKIVVEEVEIEDAPAE